MVIIAEELVQMGDRVAWELVLKRAMELDPRLNMFSRIPSVTVSVKLPLDHQAIREAMQNPDPDQSYYWTPEWQADEREADEDIKNLRFITFKSPEEAMKYLSDRYLKDDEA